jgi:hypothetical protein
MGIPEFDAQNVMEQGKLDDSKDRLGAHVRYSMLI